MNQSTFKVLWDLFNIIQWDFGGFAINWPTSSAAKLISGHVRVVYCIAPTTEWYRVRSENTLSTNLNNLKLKIIREEMEWASITRVLWSKSRMYLLWVMTIERWGKIFGVKPKKVIKMTKLFERKGSMEFSCKLLHHSNRVSNRYDIINIY